jgi:predicted ATPase
MLNAVHIKNLRSIKKQSVEIAPITVLYGPNGSGKSTLMNALAIFRNIVINPHQPLDSFFNLIFANFGGFEQVVFEHDTRKNIEMEIDCVHDTATATYKVVLGKHSGRFLIQTDTPWNVKLEPMFQPMFQPSGYNHLKPDTKLSLSQR